MSQANHTQYYDSVCCRRAVLGGCLGLPNTERVAHRVQVAFGAAALAATYPELQPLEIRLCLIVASSTGTVCYRPKSIPASAFRIGTAVSSVMSKDAEARERLSAGRLFPPLPSKRAGGAAIRDLLVRGGHENIRKSRRASALTTMGSDSFSVGISENWSTFSEKHRDSVREEIRMVAGKTSRPLLVVFDSRRGGWQLCYV